MVKQTYLLGVCLLGAAMQAQSESPLDKIESGKDLLQYLNQRAAAKPKVIKDDYYARQVDPMSDSIFYLIEEPIRKRFPGIILPNGLVAPALLDEHRNKTPACVDRTLNLHPAIWDSSEQKLVCKLSQTEMLNTEQVQKTQMASEDLQQPSHSNSVNPHDAPMKDGQYIVSKGGTSSMATQSQDTAASGTLGGMGSLTAQMAENGSLREPAEAPVKLSKSSATDQNQKQTVVSQSRGSSRQQPRATQVQPEANPYIYNPVRSAHSTGTQFFVHEASGSRYGIPIGTWVKAELKVGVNSADSGNAELVLLQSLMGTRKTLSRGTKLFARKTLNWGTERMDLSVSKVLTPELEEFSIQASVYDLGKREGLSGILKRRRKEEIKALGGKAALKTLGRSIPQGETLVGESFTGLSDDLVDQEENYLSQVPRGTIDVAPQIVWVKIENSF